MVGGRSQVSRFRLHSSAQIWRAYGRPRTEQSSTRARAMLFESATVGVCVYEYRVLANKKRAHALVSHVQVRNFAQHTQTQRTRARIEDMQIWLPLLDIGIPLHVIVCIVYAKQKHTHIHICEAPPMISV